LIDKSRNILQLADSFTVVTGFWLDVLPVFSRLYAELVPGFSWETPSRTQVSKHIKQPEKSLKGMVTGLALSAADCGRTVGSSRGAYLPYQIP